MRKDLVQTILDGLDNDFPVLSDDTLAAMRLANAAPDLLAALESVREWCYPDASRLPNDALARCEWYARMSDVMHSADVRKVSTQILACGISKT